MKFKGFPLIALATLAAFVGQTQSTNELDLQETPVITTSEQRSLHQQKFYSDWKSFKSNKQYSAFWTWYYDFEQTTLKAKCGKHELDLSTTKVSSQLAVSVVKRKAGVKSKQLDLTGDVQRQWDGVWGQWAKNEFSSFVAAGFIKISIYDDYSNNDDNDDNEDDSNNCNDGYYKDGRYQCKLCPIGTATCTSSTKCKSCHKGFTLVTTQTNSTCVQDCQLGQYLQTYFASSQNPKQGSKTPYIAANQCQNCPLGCNDCVYDKLQAKPVCYECKKGFIFDKVSGGCNISLTCEAGLFRRVAVTNQTVVNSTNVETLVCKECVAGCKHCSSPSDCFQCKEFWVPVPQVASIKNSNASCLPCPAFCQNCSYNATGRNSYCAKCQPVFYPINNGQKCQINRTCSAGQWFNDAKLGCDVCPDRCTSCVQGARNGTVNCTACTIEAKVDNKTLRCVDKCNRLVEYYSLKTNNCTTCLQGSYPNYTNQTCKPCSKNCETCGLTWVPDKSQQFSYSASGFFFQYIKNSSRGFVNITISFTQSSLKTYSNSSSGYFKNEEDCYVCQNNTFYDTNWKKCRTQCNSTSYYNFTQMQCINCLSNEFVNSLTGLCQTCPNNCTSCMQQGNRVHCTSCNPSFVVDYSTQSCRPNCTNTSLTFDFQSYSCKSCPNSTIINPTSRLCDSCPVGCGSCYYNQSSSGQMGCSSCKTFYVLDKNKQLCRMQCYGNQKFYWQTNTCRDCPPYSSVSWDTGNCTPCEEGCIDCFRRSNGKKPTCIICGSNYVFDIKTFQCKLSCNDTTIYNYNTKKCESCPLGQYYDTQWQRCYNCSTSNCAVCSKNSSQAFSTCNQCNDGYFKDKYGNCKGGCGINQYFDQNMSACITCSAGQFYNSSSSRCEACPYSCKSCSLAGGKLACQSCTGNFVLDNQRQMCRSQCSSNAPFYNQTLGQCVSCSRTQYFDSGMCNDCPANCSSCSKSFFGAITCDGCLNNWLLDDIVQQCKPQCPENQQFDWTLKKCARCPAGQWVNSTSQNCQPCPKNCSSCQYFASNMSYSCQSCYSPNILDSSRMQCKQNCPVNSYYSWSSLSCVNCPSAQYLDTQSQTCKACPSYCNNCFLNSTTSSVECTQCKFGSSLDQTMRNCRPSCNVISYYDWTKAQCQQCPDGTYKSATENICLNCPSGCTACSWNSATSQLQCQQCTSGLIVDQQKQLCRVQCNSTAVFDWNNDACINCPSWKYAYAPQNTCQNCPDRCKSCSFNSASSKIECQSCTSGSVLDPSIGVCRAQCNSTSMYDYQKAICVQCGSDQYLNPNSEKCELCQTGCTTCQVGPSGSTQPDCLSCLAGLTLDKYTCRKTCGTNQYYDWTVADCFDCPSGTVFSTQSQQCESCSSNCLNCKYDSSNVQYCTNCSSPYLVDTYRRTCRAPCTVDKPLYNTTLGNCVACPAQSLFENNQCSPCPASCTSCSRESTGKLVCPSCLNGWLLDDTVKQCKPSCPSNQQYDWTLSKCTTCSAGQWLNATNQKCQSCPTNCSSCTYISTNRSFTCQSCFSPNVNERQTCRIPCSSDQLYDWRSSSCYSCPAGTYLNATASSCSFCPSNCASCSLSPSTLAVECSTCKTGMLYNDVKKNCRPPCNSTSIYNWSKLQCIQCPFATFMNPSTESCNQCPYGCSSCALNTINNVVECQTCQNTFIIDTSKILCRQQCSTNGYYDWSLLSCINCANNQYVYSSVCNDCPSTCTACTLNSKTLNTECSSCVAGFIADSTISTCREECNSASYYDYTKSQCTQCNDGSFLNSSTSVCQACPSGCTTCQQGSTQNAIPNCLSCSQTLTLDRYQCRVNCKTNEFYDWDRLSCLGCSAGCLQCTDAATCKACDEQYNLVNGACSSKCVAGVTTWNPITKVCDPIRTFAISATMNITKTIRCRTAISTIKSSGYQGNEQPVYSWKADIISGGINQASWLPQLTTLLSNANSTNATSLYISSEITEKILDTSTIRFTVIMSVAGFTVSNTTTFTVEQFVYTTIGNYSNSYSFFASDGLYFYPAFYYPECPTIRGPAAIPATTNIGCTLYDSRGNLIKSLLYCQVKAGDTSPGYTYVIKYSYTPNSYQTSLKDSINLTVFAQPPTCSIQNASMIYVRTSDTLNLKVTVINSRTTFKYTWQCLPQSSGASCAVLSSTQNAADLSVPASSLTLNGVYNFLLQVIENSAVQTTCEAAVEVVPQTPQTFSSLTFLDNANSLNYLDPTLQQTVNCYQTQDTKAYVQYEWKWVRKSDNSVQYSSVSQPNSNFAVSSNQLTIAKNTLTSDSFDLKCFAYNLKYSGTIQKTYTTLSSASQANRLLSNNQGNFLSNYTESATLYDIVQNYQRVKALMESSANSELLQSQIETLLQSIEAYEIQSHELDQIINMLSFVNSIGATVSHTVAKLLNADITKPMRVLEQNQFSDLVKLASLEDNESIKMGALRVSGSSSRKSLIIQSKVLRVIIEKKSAQQFEDENGFSADGIVQIPYFKATGSQFVLVLLELNCSQTVEVASNNCVDITLFSTNEQINGFIEAVEVKVENLENPLTINMKVKQSQLLGSSACSFMNEQLQVWEKLNCNSIQTEGQVTCCSTHLTKFALIQEEYFEKLNDQSKRKLIYGLALPTLICIFLMMSLIQYFRTSKTQSEGVQQNFKLFQGLNLSQSCCTMQGIERKLMIYNEWILCSLTCSLLSAKLETNGLIIVTSSLAITAVFQKMTEKTGKWITNMKLMIATSTWMILLGMLLLVQAVVLMSSVKDLNLSQVSTWGITSTVSLLLSNVVFDMIVGPGASHVYTSVQKQ